MDVRCIIRKLGGRAAVAADLGTVSNTVSYWIYRNAIPARHWREVLALAEARGVRDITLSVLIGDRPAAKPRHNCPACAERLLREIAQAKRDFAA